MAHSATDLIRADHQSVESLYGGYHTLAGRLPAKRALVEQLCRELEVHAKLEEELFYPAVQAKLGQEGTDLVAAALQEHREMKRLIGQLREPELDEDSCDRRVHRLMAGVQRHVTEEEGELLPRAEHHLGVELERLGRQMQERQHQLLASLPPPGEPAQGTLAQRLTPAGQDTGGASTIARSVEVDVPVRTAYNQWTQFEEFPRFMEGIREVRQLDDRHLHWRANLGGKVKEWDAVITEQTPDRRIAWTNTTGTRNAGVVTFHRLADDKTRVMLQIDYEPEGFVENVGDLLGVVSARVRGDLDRFKRFIEARGSETGAWRGEVAQPKK
jgi:uncharacterized membrane protein/hemerythrin superfamily protein